MNQPGVFNVRRLLEKGLLLLFMCSAGIAVQSEVRAQDLRASERLESLGLETMQVGRVTAHFAPSDRMRAGEMAELTEAAAAFFERELGISFDIGVAALAPDQWFSDIPGIPYAIPWPSMPDKVIFMPSSLEEGLLIHGPTPQADRRRVDFVLLHEYGHIAAKEYFRAQDDRDYLPVSWFEELLATYFAYSFIHASDPAWTQAARASWQAEIDGFTPSVISLDWSYMSDLPGDVVAREYGWYQFMLNLRAADIHDEHGLDFLRALKDRLPWDATDTWNTAMLLPLLEELAPGFEAWAVGLPSVYGDVEPRAPAGHQSGDEAAVLEAMDRFMTAISESDLEAQEAMQTPDGMTYQWRPTGDGSMGISARPNSIWTDPARADDRVYRERYWSPSVMIRGGIAVVWAPYEFWIDGETSHCGVDVVDFVKMDGKWLVSNAMWTVEPDACAELRPVDGATVRPEG